MATGLSDMLKSGEKGKFKRKKFVLTKKAKEVFEELKQFFTTAPILVHYDPVWRIMIGIRFCDIGSHFTVAWDNRTMAPGGILVAKNAAG